MFVSSLVVAALAAVASAKQCRHVHIPLALTARGAEFNLEPLLTEIDTTDFFLGLSKQGTNYTDILLDDYHTINGIYKIAATYCQPDSGPGHTLQILTHGVGFDRSYWDLPFNKGNYSYIAAAVDGHGYSTLSWDRLGVGASSKGDPINEIQVFLELQALKALTEKAAQGTLPIGTLHKFDSIAHAGHSFGAAMTYGLARLWPELTNAIILQGFSHAPGFLSYFALGGNFVPVSQVKSLKSKYPPGYLGVQSSVGVQINFFGPKNFDPKMLEYAYQNQQAFTPGEIISVGAGVGEQNMFTGPVMVITGDNDVPFCGGNCMGTAVIGNSAPNLIAFSKQFFPKASTFNATVVPGTGHAMNMEYTHPTTYGAMLDFLDSKL